MRAALTVFATFAVLLGRVVDRTTGQPLVGVDVSAHGASKTSATRTSDTGAYQLRGLTPGHYTISLSSDDVPPQTFEITIKPAVKTQHFDITACSTTLDYSCAPVNP